MTFAYSHHGPRYNAARFFIYGLSLALRWIAASSSSAQPKASRRRSLASVVSMLASPGACSGAAHSACQPPLVRERPLNPPTTPYTRHPLMAPQARLAMRTNGNRQR